MWIVCAYYTHNYERYAKKLSDSLKQFNIPNDVQLVEDLGDWYRNTQYKPKFLWQQLKKHAPSSIVYVDVDAVFLRYPRYFDYLENWKEGPSIAVHVLDHSKYGRHNRVPELLSGTIFLRNTETTSIIVERWIASCKKSPTLWDQKALAEVLKDFQFHPLPEEYVTIFDYMASVKDPVIKHFQASRTERSKVKKKEPKTNQVYVVKRK